MYSQQIAQMLSNASYEVESKFSAYEATITYMTLDKNDLLYQIERLTAEIEALKVENFNLKSRLGETT